MPATPRRKSTPDDALRHEIAMREWTVLAQDPKTRGKDGSALTTRLAIPAERIERGPKGHRVHVIDYDASSNLFYRARLNGIDSDPYSR